MIATKTNITAIGVIVFLFLSNSVQALDGEVLYVERTCIACHGPEGRVPVMPEYPKLAGQKAAYMLGQMKDIKNGLRNNSHSVAMKNVMHLINDEEMAVVAEWLASLPE